MNEGIYNEDNTLQLIENMEIMGMGIDKTILNFNIKSEIQLQYIIGIASNTKLSNLTINVSFNENKTYTNIDNIFLLYGISESNIEFNNVKFNISINGLYLKNCEYTMNNCEFILDYKTNTSSFSEYKAIYNNYSFGKINNCIFKINHNISTSKNITIIYCRNSFISFIDNCHISSQPGSY